MGLVKNIYLFALFIGSSYFHLIHWDQFEAEYFWIIVMVNKMYASMKLFLTA